MRLKTRKFWPHERGIGFYVELATLGNACFLYLGIWWWQWRISLQWDS